MLAAAQAPPAGTGSMGQGTAIFLKDSLQPYEIKSISQTFSQHGRKFPSALMAHAPLC